MPAPPDDTEEILALEDHRYDAIVAGDIDAFAAVCHAELLYTHSSATTDTLESYTEKVKSGHYVYHRIEHPVDKVVVLGDTALVLGRMIASISVAGVPKELDNTSLAVWVRDAGAWKLAAYAPTVRPVTATVV
jgi:ketosteroid isomerase-like protein